MAASQMFDHLAVVCVAIMSLTMIKFWAECKKVWFLQQHRQGWTFPAVQATISQKRQMCFECITMLLILSLVKDLEFALNLCNIDSNDMPGLQALAKVKEKISALYMCICCWMGCAIIYAMRCKVPSWMVSVCLWGSEIWDLVCQLHLHQMANLL